MLLENNTNKVINLIYQFDDLSNIDKVRLAIYLLQNKYFNVNFNIENMINTLKSILGKLDSNYTMYTLRCKLIKGELINL